MSTPQLSARNPFRAPTVTPNPTGASVSSSVPPYNTLPPLTASLTGGSTISSPPSYSSEPEAGPPSPHEDSPEALPELTPRISPARLSHNARLSTETLPRRSRPQHQPTTIAVPSLPPRQSLNVVLSPQPSSVRTPPTVDLPRDAIPPPAYSPAPDVSGGELVVELGPRRPFQRAPEPFLSFPIPQIRPRQELQLPQPEPPRLAPRPSTASLSSRLPHSPMSDFSRDFYNAGVTTSRPPDTQRERPRREPPPRSPTSDFARDFYSEGTAFLPPPDTQREQSNQNRFDHPSLPSPGSSHSEMSGFARDFYSAGTATPPSPGTQQEQPHRPQYDPPPGPPPLPRRPRAASTPNANRPTAAPARDGRPTTTPTPGRPLLFNGKTLVYSESYLCQKCQNTGYKGFDPSHPCRKCWDRFGTPYTAILDSSPWGGQGTGTTSQSQQGRSFQRPLPALKPPQARLPPLPVADAYRLPRCSSRAWRCGTRRVPMPFGVPPPPDAAVVLPGDKRIGGRLCWQCGGRGKTPFLIFDELPCETCGGIGRLLN
ncbi:hypothetical protein F5148DRAFT_47725 [Russula earlei]|uniref:Uncharacterized protein n=1 Tax=Russula earlei TaxID=71964 RepID=A0ACC0TSP2_9AGAM|nr:hypothetical protein F5148DRAFT_47725 [Russula earlei]